MEDVKNLANGLPPLQSLKTSSQSRIIDHVKHTWQYIDIPICFDCETYSFTVHIEDHLEKRATMWAWGLAIADTCYMGRTWEEFLEALAVIKKEWHINPAHRCLIWCHNLSYDWQFFRKWFTWSQVFAMSSREICYGVTEDGFEFRCSYILTGYSLEKVGEHLTKHTIKKLVGTIDYNIPRHSKTPLTETEVEYLEHDCLVVTAHIAEQLEIEGGLSKIPLTKTSYVRRDVRNACFRDPNKRASQDFTRLRYGGFIKSLTLDPFIYESLHRAFMGGFTHANPFHSGDTMDNVSSYDFASAYPAVMCSEFFPCSPPEIVEPGKDLKTFYSTLKLYCCVFTVRFYDLKARVNFDHYLSESHCIIPKEATRHIDNGRVVSADMLQTTITNIDWEIIVRTYTCSKFEVTGLIRWSRGYLPKSIISCVIRYFQAKTELKGVEGKEQEYMTAKEMLNSIYGMMVMNPLRPKIPYNLDTNEWGQKTEDGRRVLAVKLTDEETLEALEDYNDSMSRFTYYAWGVFITAYCRKNLWRGILHFGDDYIYSDTDSIKVINADLPEHKAHIERHNERIQEKIKKCLAYHKMDPGLSVAVTPSGKRKALGVWEYEGMYSHFKTLGAKRYMVEEENTKTGGKKISITVSGINKREAVPYIVAKTAGPLRMHPEGGGDPFEFFSNNMEIPAGHAGKMIPYYGDEEIQGLVRDRDGVVNEYYEKSYIYMEPGGYSLSLSGTYVKYLYMLEKGLI